MPDRQDSWHLDDGRVVQVNIWSNVFLPDTVLTADERADPTQAQPLLKILLTVLVVLHPDFDLPMLLVTNIPNLWVHPGVR